MNHFYQNGGSGSNHHYHLHRTFHPNRHQQLHHLQQYQQQSNRMEYDDDEYIQALRDFVQLVEDNHTDIYGNNMATEATHGSICYDPWDCIMDTTKNPVTLLEDILLESNSSKISSLNDRNNLQRPIPLKSRNIPHRRKMHWVDHFSYLSKILNNVIKNCHHNDKEELHDFVLMNNGPYLSFSDFSVYREQFNDDDNIFLASATSPNAARTKTKLNEPTFCVPTSDSNRHVFC